MPEADSSEGLIEAALIVVGAAHADQKDKLGVPYVLHPLRVMLAVAARGEVIAATALLHDVVEDSPVTLAHLASTFPAEVVVAVDALTRRPKEPYRDYLKRVKASRMATLVKQADLRDNLRRSGSLPNSKTLTKRYRNALTFLAGP